MRVLEIQQNDHKRNFLTIEIESNESCKCEPYHNDRLFQYSFYPVDKSDRTAEVLIRRASNTTGLTGQFISWRDTYNVGSGSGPAMGWTIGLTESEALNLAKGICAAIESMELVAAVYHNVHDGEIRQLNENF